MSALEQSLSVIDPHELSIVDAKLPAVYESAKLALSECSRIDECKDWANKAEALASYARQADDDTLRNMAIRIQARAIRRCGELLKAIEVSKGGRPKKNEDVFICSTCGESFGSSIDPELLPLWHCPNCGHHQGQDRAICGNCHTVNNNCTNGKINQKTDDNFTRTQAVRNAKTTEGDHTSFTRTQAARNAGLSEWQQVTAVRVANVPTEQFENAVESEKPPTVTKFAEMGTKPRNLIDLKGRDPEDFKACTRALGNCQRFDDFAAETSPTSIVRGASGYAKTELRERLPRIIAWVQKLQKEIA
jgi:rubrerythrin